MIFACDYRIVNRSTVRKPAWFITYTTANPDCGPFDSKDEAVEFFLLTWELEKLP